MNLRSELLEIMDQDWLYLYLIFVFCFQLEVLVYCIFYTHKAHISAHIIYIYIKPPLPNVYTKTL